MSLSSLKSRAPNLTPSGKEAFADRFMSYIRKGDGCWLWIGHRDRRDYGRFKLAGVSERAHRVAWRLANGVIPEGQWVLHRCDNPPCVNPQHLFLGTTIENNADRHAKGRSRGPRGVLHPTHHYPELYQGERNGRAKLCKEDVRSIRSTPKIGARTLAKKFNVSRATIRWIRKGKNWRCCL